MCSLEEIVSSVPFTFASAEGHEDHADLHAVLGRSSYWDVAESWLPGHPLGKTALIPWACLLHRLRPDFLFLLCNHLQIFFVFIGFSSRHLASLLTPLLPYCRKTRTERSKLPKQRRGRNSWKRKKGRDRREKMGKSVSIQKGSRKESWSQWELFALPALMEQEW